MARFRQDAYKLNNICARWLSSKRIVNFQSDQITGVAESDCCFKRQLPAQLGKELCTRSRFSNDKCACSADIHDVIAAQFSCEHARTKSPVSDVDTPEDGDVSLKCHRLATSLPIRYARKEMQGLAFEWDPKKERANWRKHVIRIANASTVFGDPLSITIPDPEQVGPEERFVIIGMSRERKLLVVVHTMRGARIRIISARKATRHERHEYEETSR